jgi:hypothetical protein
MKESSATILALLTIVAAIYLMNLTDGQGVGWRNAKKAPVAEATK